ncbi:hypothetical protein Tsp_11121 [Trichinella spiralis]|uniref:hypothetical protein n=1 Tax=Trichinella spiralis TaxID=6334 RepID=UPI0001EFBD8D|nr:hypothetical protein Tsp_11121 [Trichinella spiralis]
MCHSTTNDTLIFAIEADVSYWLGVTAGAEFRPLTFSHAGTSSCSPLMCSSYPFLDPSYSRQPSQHPGARFLLPLLPSCAWTGGKKKGEKADGIGIFAGEPCTRGFRNLKCWDVGSNGSLVPVLPAGGSFRPLKFRFGMYDLFVVDSNGCHMKLYTMYLPNSEALVTKSRCYCAKQSAGVHRREEIKLQKPI